MPLNVMEHESVPEHHLLSEEEAAEALSRLKIEKEQLPKIKRSDPCIKFLEASRGETIEEGRVVKIVRRSPTAGKFEAYRVIVER